MYSKTVKSLATVWLLLVITPFHVTADSVSFLNYSKRITLNRISDSHYELPGKNIRFYLTNRFVVKTEPGISKETLQTTLESISDIVELYKLENGIYYSLESDNPENLEALIKQTENLPFIRLVQPDLLQDTQRAEKSSTSLTNDHISALKIDQFWKKTKGSGVKIAIIDDGFDLNHEDLKGITVDFAYDMEKKSLNPSPVNPVDVHGTRIAGVIFALHNGIGVDGIAPESSLIAIRHPDTWTSKTILSFYLAKLAKADVVNCSWHSQYLLEPVEDVIRDLTNTGRDGKGTTVVFAAGNQARTLTAGSSEASIKGVLAVGSVNKTGNKLRFSNYGEQVDIFTLGRDILTTNSSTSRKYIRFSGTSASAAIISGLIALLLSDNAELRLDEIKKNLKTYFDL